MHFRRPSLLLTCLWLAITSVVALEPPIQHAEPNVSAVEIFSINPTNVSLSAPYHRNVTNGSVWVIPSSAFDLGAREMSCECFDPDQTCCMAITKSIAPFCIAKNSTCCGDTYCNPGETCCGNSCCPFNTTCTSNPIAPGCCSVSQTCDGPASCFDAASPNCSNSSPLAQCCPSSVPYCRSFAPYGLGCFASSTLAIEAPVPSYEVTLVQPAGAVASEPVTSPTSTTTVTVTDQYNAPKIMETSTGAFLTPTTTITIIYTINPEAAGKTTSTYSFPSRSDDPLATTDNEIVFPPSFYTTTVANTTSTTTTTSSVEPTPITTITTTIIIDVITIDTITPTTTSVPSLPTTTSTSTPKTTTSALCFNPTLETNLPCPSTPSSPYNYSPPGATTIRSQSTSLTPLSIFTLLLDLSAHLQTYLRAASPLAVLVSLFLGLLVAVYHELELEWMARLRALAREVVRAGGVVRWVVGDPMGGLGGGLWG